MFAQHTWHIKLHLHLSFTRLNGVPACASDKLLNDILRKEWKFKGYVIADAGAIHHMIDQHKYYHDPMEACVGSLKAGCNLECQGNIQHRTYLNIRRCICLIIETVKWKYAAIYIFVAVSRIHGNLQAYI